MNSNLALKWLVVCAAGILPLAGSASAQTSGIFKVSNAIEGTAPGVSVARCGGSIVAGFGDAEPHNNNSAAGYAVSKNASLFTDPGVLPVPPQGANSVSSSTLGPIGPYAYVGRGNPVVACSNPFHSYYASVYTNFNDCPLLPCTAISVSPSIDGGQTWGFPVVASMQSGDIYQFAAPTTAVDPTNPLRIYVAYINNNFVNPFDFSDCPSINGIAILEFTSSSDGGKTWSPRTQLDHSCVQGFTTTPPSGTLMTPNVVVSSGGNVYLTYELAGANVNGQQTPNEIRFMRSLDNGKTFSAPSIVSTMATNDANPQLAVDRSKLRSRGEIYLTWSGARSAVSTDVLVADSVNNGVSFSFPRPISPAPLVGPGHFQTNPVIALDFDGQVGVCFYNTPTNAPTSSSVYSYNCATSFNRAASWTTRLVKSAVPVGYDALTTDFLLHNDGFLTTFEVQVNGTRSVVGQEFETN
jgi:hypothetical protein